MFQLHMQHTISLMLLRSPWALFQFAFSLWASLTEAKYDNISWYTNKNLALTTGKIKGVEATIN